MGPGAGAAGSWIRGSGVSPAPSPQPCEACVGAPTCRTNKSVPRGAAEWVAVCYGRNRKRGRCRGDLRAEGPLGVSI